VNIYIEKCSHKKDDDKKDAHMRADDNGSSGKNDTKMKIKAGVLNLFAGMGATNESEEKSTYTAISRKISNAVRGTGNVINVLSGAALKYNPATLLFYGSGVVGKALLDMLPSFKRGKRGENGSEKINAGDDGEEDNDDNDSEDSNHDGKKDEDDGIDHEDGRSNQQGSTKDNIQNSNVSVSSKRYDGDNTPRPDNKSIVRYDRKDTRPAAHKGETLV